MSDESGGDLGEPSSSIGERMIAGMNDFLDGLKFGERNEDHFKVKDVFRCAMCGDLFAKTWRDEEARMEAIAKGIQPVDGCLVCDECYRKTPWGGNLRRTEMVLQPTDLSRLNEIDRRRVRRYRMCSQVLKSGWLKTTRYVNRDVKLPDDATISQINGVSDGKQTTHTYLIHSMTFDPVPDGTEPADLFPQPVFDEPVTEAKPDPLTWRQLPPML